MAENKRFECYDLIYLDGFIKDTLTNENIVEPIRLIHLLNELAEENKRLQHDLEIYEENNTNRVLNQLRIELTSRLNDCIEEFKE